MPAEIDVNALVEERIAFLKAAHPEVNYDMRLAPERPIAVADPDLIKGVLTNLLENAAEAAQPGGVVLACNGDRGIEAEYRGARFGPGLERAGASRACSSRPFRSRKAAWGWGFRSRAAARCCAAAICWRATANWAARRFAWCCWVSNRETEGSCDVAHASACRCRLQSAIFGQRTEVRCCTLKRAPRRRV